MNKFCLRILLFFIASFFMAGNSFAMQWIKHLYDKEWMGCIEAPDFSSLKTNDMTLDVSADIDKWQSTGVKVDQGKSIKFAWNMSKLYKVPLKVRVLYRIDPRFPKPQLFTKVYSFSTNSWSSSFDQYVGAYGAGSLTKYQAGSYQSTDNTHTPDVSSIKNNFSSYFADLSGATRVFVRKGQTVNISLISASDFFGASGYPAEVDPSDVTYGLNPTYIYTSSKFQDNSILYLQPSVACGSTSFAPVATCQSSAMTFQNVNMGMFTLGMAGFTSSAMSRCADSVTGYPSSVCYYDLGRGMAITIGGVVVKSESKSFTNSSVTGQSFFSTVAANDGWLDFTTSWDISNMFGSFNQYMSGWGGATSPSSADISAVTLNYMHLGRYIMEVEIGDGNVIPLAQGLIVEYAISSSSPDSNTAGAPVMQNNEIFAPSDGNLWIRIRNVGSSDVRGGLKIYYSNYSGDTTISNFIWGDVISPICKTLKDITKTLYSNLASDSSLKRAAFAMLNLYLVLYALFFLAGAVEIKASDLVNRVIKIAIVVALFSKNSWDLFNEYFFNVFINGSSYLMNNIIGTNSSNNIFGYMDFIFDKFTNMNLWGNLIVEILQIYNGMIIFGVLVLIGLVDYFFLLATVVTEYVMSFIMLSVLISLAPIFITFMLFKKTANLFNNWLSAIFNAAIYPTILLIFCLLINDIMTAQLENAVVRSCWDVWIPFLFSFNINIMGFVEIDLPPIYLSFLPGIPFYVPTPDNGALVRGAAGSYLTIMGASISFYLFSKMASGVAPFVTGIVQALTSSHIDPGTGSGGNNLFKGAASYVGNAVFNNVAGAAGSYAQGGMRGLTSYFGKKLDDKVPGLKSAKELIQNAANKGNGSGGKGGGSSEGGFNANVPMAEGVRKSTLLSNVMKGVFGGKSSLGQSTVVSEALGKVASSATTSSITTTGAKILQTATSATASPGTSVAGAVVNAVQTATSITEKVVTSAAASSQAKDSKIDVASKLGVQSVDDIKTTRGKGVVLGKALQSVAKDASFAGAYLKGKTQAVAGVASKAYGVAKSGAESLSGVVSARVAQVKNSEAYKFVGKGAVYISDLGKKGVGIGKSLFGGVTKVGSKAYSGVSSRVSGAYKFLASRATGAINFVDGVVGNSGKRFESAAAISRMRHKNNIVSKIGGDADNLRKGVVGKAGVAINYVSDLGKKGVGIGNSFVGGITNALSKAYSGVSSRVSGVYKLVDKGAIGVTNFVDDLAKNSKNRFESAAAISRMRHKNNIASKIGKDVEESYKSITNIMDAGGDNVSKVVSGAKDNLVKAVTNVTDKSKVEVQSAGSYASKKVSEARKAVVDSGSKGRKSVTDALDKAKGFIIPGFEKVSLSAKSSYEFVGKGSSYLRGGVVNLEKSVVSGLKKASDVVGKRRKLARNLSSNNYRRNITGKIATSISERYHVVGNGAKYIGRVVGAVNRKIDDSVTYAGQRVADQRDNLQRLGDVASRDALRGVSRVRKNASRAVAPVIEKASKKLSKVTTPVSEKLSAISGRTSEAASKLYNKLLDENASLKNAASVVGEAKSAYKDALTDVTSMIKSGGLLDLLKDGKSAYRDIKELAGILENILDSGELPSSKQMKQLAVLSGQEKSFNPNKEDMAEMMRIKMGELKEKYPAASDERLLTTARNSLVHELESHQNHADRTRFAKMSEEYVKDIIDPKGAEIRGLAKEGKKTHKDTSLDKVKNIGSEDALKSSEIISKINAVSKEKEISILSGKEMKGYEVTLSDKLKSSIDSLSKSKEEEFKKSYISKLSNEDKKALEATFDDKIKEAKDVYDALGKAYIGDKDYRGIRREILKMVDDGNEGIKSRIDEVKDKIYDKEKSDNDRSKKLALKPSLERGKRSKEFLSRTTDEKSVASSVPKQEKEQPKPLDIIEAAKEPPKPLDKSEVASEPESVTKRLDKDAPEKKEGMMAKLSKRILENDKKDHGKAKSDKEKDEKMKGNNGPMQFGLGRDEDEEERKKKKPRNKAENYDE